MDSLHDFISTNMVLVNFFYGQVFFVTGLAIALQQRGLSNFRLARYLWLLASFGILHGIAEWGNVFIPIQNAYLSDSWMHALRRAQEIGWGVSYAFLLQFALNMIIPWLGWGERAQTIARRSVPVWGILVTLTGVFLLGSTLGESLIRYYLGFPAAFLTAIAFLGERHSFKKFPSPSAKINLVLTASLFGVYSLLAGFVVRQSGVWPLEWLNYENVFSTTGLPIQVYRAFVGLAIAFFIIRTLSIFDVEIKQRLEDSERSEALLKDRQRIARDLHDGVVQSIYAAGLQLEVISKSVHSDPDKASEAMKKVMAQLNEVISNIRKFIFKLGQVRTGEANFGDSLTQLAKEFSQTDHLQVDVKLRGQQRELGADTEQNLVFMVRECLNNVVKHARADIATIRIDYQDEAVTVSVQDDGGGFRTEGALSLNYGADFVTGESCRGLRSMMERATAIGAGFSISNMLKTGGTLVIFNIPYGDEERIEVAG
jgi:signal transduction histidine kinase